MHVHNVSSYAPPGYKLARTEYEGDRTKHVFCRLDAPDSEIALECMPGNAAEEVGHLERFRELHTPVATPEPANVYAQPITVADLSHPDATGPAPAFSTSAKPSRKRS